MKPNIPVSVIIPTYNRAAVVCTAIDSVLGQTYQNTEVIVVDDGSSDHTEEVLRGYGDRIRVIKQANAGPATARNRGIATARGKIVAFLDSDDYWLPSKVARQVALLENGGQAIPCCLCNCKVQSQNGDITSSFRIADVIPECSVGLWYNPAEVLMNRYVLFNQAIAIWKQVLERVGSFDERLRFVEDYELSMRLSLEGPWAILREELVVYNAASVDSLAVKASTEERTRLAEDLLLVREKFLTLVERNPAYSRFHKIARRQVRRQQRALIAAQLSQQTYPGAASVGRALQIVERLRRGLSRRGPLYPRILVEPLTFAATGGYVHSGIPG